MNARQQLFCAWSIIPFVLVYILGFMVIARFVPPQAPGMTPAELVSFYNQHRMSIRAGQLIGLVASALLLLWAGAISAQMARIELAANKGGFPTWSLVQYGAAVVLQVFFLLCGLIWSIAAYREDLDPQLLRLLNDSGWLIFVMAYPEYLVQLGSIALVGLMDTRAQPLLPRWACFFTLWVAFAGIGGGFATFFKSGPFAWNGLFGFWLPVAFFLVWLVAIMLPFLVRGIRQQLAEEAAASGH
jgi:hypothetical protein